MKSFRIFALAALGWAFALAETTGMRSFLEEQSLTNLGERTFARYCAGCHGAKGDASTASPLLDPKPRDLTSGTFKFRSTATGMLPTDADLMRTLAQGIVGTSMPKFGHLPEIERKALVAYVKTLSPAWREDARRAPAVRLPEFPETFRTDRAAFLEEAEAGKKIFATSCALCHGHDGKGAGPSAEGLTDDWDRPIKPADLTLPYVKGGYDLEAIARGVGNGLSGSPMAGFYPTLSERDFIRVVAYVFYLRGEAAGVYAPGTIQPIAAPAVQ